MNKRILQLSGFELNEAPVAKTGPIINKPTYDFSNYGNKPDEPQKPQGATNGIDMAGNLTQAAAPTAPQSFDKSLKPNTGNLSMPGNTKPTFDGVTQGPKTQIDPELEKLRKEKAAEEADAASFNQMRNDRLKSRINAMVNDESPTSSADVERAEEGPSGSAYSPNYTHADGHSALHTELDGVPGHTFDYKVKNLRKFFGMKPKGGWDSKVQKAWKKFKEFKSSL